MVLEAQWDRPNVAERQHVTDCLRSNYDGETIMASMGSLGHYMQEMSRDGFALRNFLHEGNGDIWLAALDGPRPFVGWILIEEKASGGDMLAMRARANPHFLDGFTRGCEGAGTALKAAHKSGVIVAAIDGGCAVIPYLKSGEVTATSAQFPGKMAALGVEAINTVAKTGKKPAVTPGLGFFNTGTKLFTGTPVDGVPSGTPDQLSGVCWKA